MTKGRRTGWFDNQLDDLKGSFDSFVRGASAKHRPVDQRTDAKSDPRSGPDDTPAPSPISQSPTAPREAPKTEPSKTSGAKVKFRPPARSIF